MALPQLELPISSSSDERRRFPRVRISLPGRYMLPDRREFPCQVLDMSAGGIALLAPVIAAQSDQGIAYIDQIGRLEGFVARHIPDGFAMTLVATGRKRDKLAAQLEWFANRGDLPENRRHDRI